MKSLAQLCKPRQSVFDHNRRDVVYVYNMRYKESVEDCVHQLLSERLAGIYTLFGQLPDCW
jgi:hypothetical protein